MSARIKSLKRKLQDLAAETKDCEEELDLLVRQETEENKLRVQADYEWLALATEIKREFGVEESTPLAFRHADDPEIVIWGRVHYYLSLGYGTLSDSPFSFKYEPSIAFDVTARRLKNFLAASTDLKSLRKMRKQITFVQEVIPCGDDPDVQVRTKVVF